MFELRLFEEAKAQFTHFTEPVKLDDALTDKLIDYFNLTQIRGYFIRDGNVEMDSHFEDKCVKKFDSKSESKYIRDRDLRCALVLNMLQASCNFYKRKHKATIPNTYIFVLIADQHPWKFETHPHYATVSKVPIFCFSRPRNDRHYPLLPETTFQHFNFEEKFDSAMEHKSTWDVQKQYLHNATSKSAIVDTAGSITKCVFFKGSLSGQRSYNLRWHLLRQQRQMSQMSQMSAMSVPIDIQVSNKDNFESIDKWNRYDFVLNLPGHMPWSNRAKYLLLLPHPLMIDVQVQMRKFKTDPTSGLAVLDYCDEPYETFLELCLGIKSASETPWARVEYVYERVDKTEIKTAEKVAQVVRDIQDICQNKSQYYRKQQDAVREQLMQLSDNHIYQYVADCIVQNSKIVVLC